MSGQIFISYRREDSRWSAQSLYGRLCARFDRKQILMDIDAISPGDDFVQAIEKMVSECDVLIALIGVNWLSSRDERDARRLDNGEDFVRREIATALKRNIRVIPVLVDGASMPRSTDLPDDLKSLVSRQAVEVSHDRFAADSERLIGAIERALGRSIKPFHRWKQWAGLSAVVIALVVAAIFLYNGGRRPVLQPTPAPSVSPIAVATSAATPAVTPGQPPSDVFGDLSATATMTTALFVPALGLRIAFITLQQSQSMLGAMPPGALVMEVESNGAAGKAGINAGDVVEAIGSQKIDTLDDMRKSFRELGPGKTQFTIRRSDARKTVLVDCPNC